MIKKMLPTLAAGLALAGSASVTPANAQDAGQFIKSAEHGQCLTVEGSGFVNTITGHAQPYGVTTRPCTEGHKTWQTWNVDTTTRRIRPAAYPDKCLQVVPDGRFLYLQTLPCDPDNTTQDFTFQNSQFRGEPLLRSGHTIEDHTDDVYVGAYRKEDAGTPIGVHDIVGPSSPNERWKLTTA